MGAGRDVDGDGLSDLLVGAQLLGEAYLHRGRAGVGLDPAPAAVFTSPGAGDLFPWQID
jgi:hypothetical protein